MKTAPKLQHFMWRILSNALAAGTTLVYRGITRNSQCTRCHKAEESIEHLFFDCEYVQAIWQSNSVFQNIHPTRSFEEKFRAIMECYNNQNLSDLERQLPIWTLWRIWKSRNQLVYQKKGSHWQEDKIKAEIEAKEWVDCWPMVTSVTTSNSCRIRSTSSAWTKPKEGYVKCNYDCKFFQNGHPSQAAWIFRDSDGFFLHAGHSIGKRCSSVLEAEIQALIMAMQQAWVKGFTNVIFEGDNNSVTKLVNGEILNFNVHNWIREANFWKIKLPNAEFKWTSRHNNKAADRLAKEHFQGHLRFESFFFVPAWLVNILHEDHSFD